MANTRVLQRSFSGGEMSPEMYGKIDDAKFQAGLATCRNFIAMPQGPVENRPGFAFVNEVKDSTKAVRLIPFTFNTTDTMVIEMGHHYFRFHSCDALYKEGLTLMTDGTLDTPASGKTPYEVVSSYSSTHLFDIHYVQSADVLTLVHPAYPPAELRRSGAVSWALTDISFTPTVSAPSGVSGVSDGVTTYKAAYSYVVTSIAADGVSESVASTEAIAATVGISSVTKANPCVITTSINPHKLIAGTKIVISGELGMTQLNGTYIINTTPAANTMTIRDASTGAVVNSTSYGTFTGGGFITPHAIIGNLNETGASNTISWSAATGASRYYVYKQQGGIYGYIGNTTSLSLTDNNIAPDMSRTPPTYETVFGSALNYPGAVSYYEQRRVFAGTPNQPQNIWMTVSGTESQMSYSLPLRDTDRIAVRVAAREANTIRHIVPLSQLVLLTSAAEWKVTSVNSDAITPTSISVKPQSYVGASNVQPTIINNQLVYCAARGGHVRELGYNWQANGFITGDMSLRAAHLFDTYTIADMCYSKAPQPIIWFVSSSGKLLGLTYVPEQQIGAWHQHDTDGSFESCTCVAEGGEDVLYVVVNRTINGSTKRYVERLKTRMFSAQEDAFFVDCGATYDSTPTTTISGLGHLEGKTVNILADGAVHPQRVVTGGEITLDVEASVVQIGLPITADLQTLPAAMQVDGFGQGRMKNVNKAWLRVYRSSGIFVGPDSANLVEAKQRTTELYGSPPALKSDEIQVMLTPAWASGGQVFVRQTDPLPLTVVGLTLEIAIGG